MLLNGVDVVNVEQWIRIRSSRPGVFGRKYALKNRKIHRKTPVLESILNKVAV